MTLDQITHNIYNTAYRIKSDDSDLDLRQIEFWVHIYRARLLKEYYEKRKQIDSIYVQDLGCIEMECRNIADCCDFDINIPILRSKQKIPTPIELPFGSPYTFVGLINKTTPIALYDISTIFFSNYARYTKFLRKAFFLDNYIHITSYIGDNIKYINIQGLFEDPTKIAEFKKCNTNENCFDVNTSEYPIPSHLLQILTQMILEREIKIAVNGMNLTDNTNDSDDNPKITKSSSLQK
jgi:hypothetical protein